MYVKCVDKVLNSQQKPIECTYVKCVHINSQPKRNVFDNTFINFIYNINTTHNKVHIYLQQHTIYSNSRYCFRARGCGCFYSCSGCCYCYCSYCCYCSCCRIGSTCCHSLAWSQTCSICSHNSSTSRGRTIVPCPLAPLVLPEIQ